MQLAEVLLGNRFVIRGFHPRHELPVIQTLGMCLLLAAGPGGRADAPWLLDTSFTPRFTTTRGVALQAAALQADGRVVVAGNFGYVNGTPHRGLARLDEFGRPDRTFDAGSGTDGVVYALAVQPDGRILLAGRFASVQGQPRTALARLEPDGRLDPTFAPQLEGRESTVFALAVQPDGRILVTGSFHTVAGQPRDGLARLLPDGHPDESFDPGAGLNGGAGYDLAVAADGHIWVGGDFARVDHVSTAGVARLKPDGRVDAGFQANLPTNPAGRVYAVFPAPGGGVYAGGRFSGVGEAALNALVRLLPDGRMDMNFALPGELWGGAQTVFDVLVTPAGSVIVTGEFDSVGAVERAGLAQFTPQGAVDEAFDAELEWTAPPRVHRLLRLPDGRLVVVGAFSAAGGQPRQGVARFYPDGALDESFAGPELRFETEGLVRALGRAADGALLVAGDFERVNDEVHPGVARLRPDGKVDPDFKAELCDTARVYAAVQDARGRWLLAGEFDQVGATTCQNLIRLLADGQPDPGFVPPEINGPVLALALAPSGGILAGGEFTRVDQFRRLGLVRLLEDGSVDDAFDVRLESALSDPRVSTLALDEVGRLYVGGHFHLVNGQPRTHLARLLEDGSVDAEYAPALSWGGEEPEVRSLALFPDGRCVLGGCFTSLQEQPRPGLARLRPDGSLDAAFQPAVRLRPGKFPCGAWSVIALPDLRVAAAGAFSDAEGARPMDLVLLDEHGQLLGEASAAPGEGKAAWFALAAGHSLTLIAGGGFAPVQATPGLPLARFLLASYQPEFRVHIAREPDAVVLDWLNEGRLETASAPRGPWLEVPGATAPYRVPTDSGARFFRLVR